MVKIAILLVVAAVGVAGIGATVWNRLARDGKAVMPPPPRLFPDAQARSVDTATFAAARQAGRIATTWLAAHPAATDATFSAWALATLPTPARGPALRPELRSVEAAVAARTPEQAAAALWLEQWGKKAVWKLYLKQAWPVLAADEAKRAKVALKAALALGSTLTGTAKAQVKRPSPYEVDPRLAAVNKAKFNGQVRYSFPSKHDVLEFAALVVLDRVDPRRSSEFRWMADQVSYSRLAGGGHYPSDLAAGAYLGTLVGHYELRRAGL